MTLYEIEILAHYHCSRRDWMGPSFGNDLYNKTMDGFVSQGLLVRTHDTESPMYLPTERLHAYINFLQEVPLPVEVAEWRLPCKKEEKE